MKTFRAGLTVSALCSGNADQPKVGETLAGIDAGKWIYKQNADFRAGRLSEKQVGLLREIGVI